MVCGAEAMLIPPTCEARASGGRPAALDRHLLLAHGRRADGRGASGDARRPHVAPRARAARDRPLTPPADRLSVRRVPRLQPAAAAARRQGARRPAPPGRGHPDRQEVLPGAHLGAVPARTHLRAPVRRRHVSGGGSGLVAARRQVRARGGARPRGARRRRARNGRRARLFAQLRPSSRRSGPPPFRSGGRRCSPA